MIKLFANIFLTLKNRYFLFIDIIIFSIIPFLAIYIRIENLDEIQNYLSTLYNILPYYILIKVVIFYMLGLYKRMWRFASIEEYVRILFAGLFILFFQYILTLLFEKYSQPLIALPNSIPLIDAFLAVGYFGLSRFSIRIIEVSNQRKNKTSRSNPVIIIGAGVTGVKLLKDIQSDQNSQLYPVAFVDDNISKIGTSIGDVAVEGSLKDLTDQFYHKLQQAYIKKREILCNALNDCGLTPIVPKGAYYILANISKIDGVTSKEKMMNFLNKTKIAGVPGEAFYHDDRGSSIARFCFAKRDDVLFDAVNILKSIRY